MNLPFPTEIFGLLALTLVTIVGIITLLFAVYSNRET